MRRSLAMALAVLACLGLTACGSDKETQAEAKQHLCQSVDDFAASVLSLQGLGLQSASEDDLNSASGNVTDAWDRVVADAKDLKNVSTDTIDAAYEDLTKAIEDRPTDKPVAEVVAGLQPKIAAFAEAWTDFANSVKCSTS